MAATALGLFENSSVADAVLDALLAHGIPERDIRTLAPPTGSSGASMTSTPSVDFSAALALDLRSMGATPSECEAYVDGVRHGNVLIFASGTLNQADAATAIMNQFGAIELDEFAGVAPALPAAHMEETHVHASTLKSARAKGEGARLFSW